MERFFLEWLLRALEASLLSHGTGRLRAWIRHRLTVLWTNRMHGSVAHYPSRCNATLLEEVLSLGSRFYEGSTGLEAREIRERHLRNPQITTAIVAVNRQTGLKSVIGFYVLLPLTERGTEALQTGRAQGSRHLRDDDIDQTFERFAALYVSAVFGVDTFARIATANFLLTAILEHKDQRPALKLVFVRATTPAGRAIFESLTGRAPVLGPVQTIDLEDHDVRARYRERVIRVKNIGQLRRRRG